jgi:hypothetical protein
MAGRQLLLSIACGAVLAAGCATGPTAAPGSATPSAGPGGSPAGSPAGTQHVVAGPLALDIPASWHVRAGQLNPSGNVSLAFLAPIELPAECQAAAGGGAICHPWPIVGLHPGGILVAVRLHGMPGSHPPAGGDPIVVAGQSARRISGPADQGCLAIGGLESVDVILPGDTSGWLGIDACVAGPDVTPAEADFAAILATVAMAEPAPSP